MASVKASLVALTLSTLAAARSAGTPNTFEIVGNSGASAQQLFLGSDRYVYVVDKTERNGNNFTIDTPVFHPAWSAEYDLVTDTVRPMDIITNSFCAGGIALGNGTFLNVGGNAAVGTAGLSVASGDGPYRNLDGGRVARVLDSCPFNNSCIADWTEWTGMPRNRWYPTLVTLADGAAMIIGGELYGGYVNDAVQLQNNPTFEFVPPRGDPITMEFLVHTQPLNLYPITYLLPSGGLMLQAGNTTVTYDLGTNTEVALADMPHGQRVYPASAGTTTLMQTPADNYTLTAIFCGGLNQDANNDYNADRNDVTQFVGITSCTTIAPDRSRDYVDTDDLPEGVVMFSLINLPDGRLFGLNGCATGTAGYGWQNYGNGQGYGKNPRLTPAGYYNHSAPAGQRWSREGVQASTVPRMYHSTATLLPDGSIMVAGSNPNADFIGTTFEGISVNASDPYHTEYRVERFYPDYWGKPRPVPSGLPDAVTYGGQYFDFKLPRENVTSIASLNTLRVTLVRTGFATHAMNFGQQAAELPVSYTIEQDGTATVHVGQLPPNANVFAPGPALLFVLMDGVPSVAKYLLIGNGQIGTQPVAASVAIPATDNSVGIDPQQTRDNTSNNAAANADTTDDAGLSSGAKKGIIIGAIAVGVILMGLGAFLAWRRRSASKRNAANVADYRNVNRVAAAESSPSLTDKDYAYANPAGYHSTANLADDAQPTSGYRSQRGAAY